MGPTGVMEPIGPLTFEQAKEAFAGEQARSLKAGGADVLWIETMSSREWKPPLQVRAPWACPSSAR